MYCAVIGLFLERVNEMASTNAVSAATFDPSQFNSSVDVILLIVPVAKTNAFMKRLKPFIFNRPKMRSVITPDACPAIFANYEEHMRGVLLSEENGQGDSETDLLSGLPTVERDWILSEGATPIRYKVELGYELLSVEQVLRQVLPSDIPEVPSSFETAGHIAHLNLREEVLPHKFIIAKVILDKNPRITTVVNKTASIATEFRTFPLEVLAGDDDLVVELKEGGASFKLDFRSVYWNSRLQFEHTRLSDLIAEGNVSSSSVSSSVDGGVGSKRVVAEQGEAAENSFKRPFRGKPNKQIKATSRGVVVADLMAGVGPFAIPLAQRGCLVHANDLNPDSFKWLVHNTKLNHVENSVHCSNGDAREFVAKLRGRSFNGENSSELRNSTYAPESSCGQGHEVVWFDHAIMNLPQTAIEFLDAFQGYLYTGLDCVKQEIETEGRKLPMIHVYCFEKETDETSESAALAAIRRCCEVLSFEIPRSDIDVHVVRYVSPQKPMLCLSFRLPLEVASRPPKF